MKLALGLYGLYLMLVAIKGNGTKFVTALQADVPGFLPWLIAAAVLGALYQYDKTRTFAGAFLLLAVITFVTKNFAQLKQQFSAVYNTSLQPATTAPQNTGFAPLYNAVQPNENTTPQPVLPAPAASTGQQ